MLAAEGHAHRLRAAAVAQRDAKIAALEERKVVQLTEGDETNTIDYDPKRLIASVSNRI